MYKDPKRYGFIFQSYVQLTMLQMHDEIEQTNKLTSNRKLMKTHQLNVTKDRSLILKDLTNKDQSIVEINDKKRKSSPNDDCLTNHRKVMKTNQSTNETDDPKLDAISEIILKSTTKTNEIDETKQPNYSINMMERSIFSARYIFVENLFQKYDLFFFNFK